MKLGVHAGEALGARKAGEVALVLLHPRAEPSPERAGFGIVDGTAIDEDE
jgi:hypothetical protein